MCWLQPIIFTGSPGFIKRHYFKLVIKFTQKLSECSIRVFKLIVTALLECFNRSTEHKAKRSSSAFKKTTCT